MIKTFKIKMFNTFKINNRVKIKTQKIVSNYFENDY